MTRKPRMTGPTMLVLRALLDAYPRKLAGSDFINHLKIYSGTLYPIFDRLETAGWIEGTWEDGDPSHLKRPLRKFYQLTALGERRAMEELSIRGAIASDAWKKPISIFG